MKVILTQTINNLKGIPYLTAENESMTLGHIIAEALATSEIGGKMKLYALAQKSFAEKEMDVDSADLKLIKDCVDKCKTYNHNALILGQALTLLEDVK